MLKLYPSSLGLAVAMAAVGFNPTTVQADEQADQNNNPIEEIIVTSRRRQESVQDVPLSVTAFGAEAINQLKPTSLRDFDGLAPNVYIGMSAAAAQGSAIYIRGQGYADVEKSQSPQVGVIVDGIQMGSSTGQLIDVFDVESLEINRGPQGIFFGKNTIGGNIVVNRVRPQFNELGFAVSGEAGNYDLSTFKARINIPLVDDQLALKIGSVRRDRDGYYKNKGDFRNGETAGDVEFQSFTVALRWAPTENLDAILTYDKIDDTSQLLPQDPRFDGDDRFVTRANKEEPTDYQVEQLALRVDWDINEWLTLHSITGINDSSDDVNQDFDGAALSGAASPFARLHTLREQEYDVTTQELRLDIAINDNLDAMVGLYYFDSELKFSQRTNNTIQVPLGLPSFLSCAGVGFQDNPNPDIGNALCQFPDQRAQQLSSEDVESMSYFASLTWRPTEKLELALGVRYIDEEKDIQSAFFGFADGSFTDDPATEFDFAGFPQTVGLNYQNSDDWQDTIWQGSANYELTDDARLYFSYSEGFRSGGFSIRNARLASESSYEPEDANQYEVGVKSKWYDGKLLLNLAYFQLEDNNGQFSSVITIPGPPGTTTIINNAKRSVSSGVELETRWLINDNFSLQVNGGLLDVENDAYQKACLLVDTCTLGGVQQPVDTIRNLGGNSDSRQPEWNFAMNLAFDKQIGRGMLSANVGYKKVGRFVLANTGGEVGQNVEEGGYHDWSARIAYEMELAQGDMLTFSVFGKNLTDEEWKEQALFLGGPTTGFQGWGAPRTYALEVKYSR